MYLNNGGNTITTIAAHTAYTGKYAVCHCSSFSNDPRPLTKRMYSTADQAKLTRRITFSPSAATRFGVKPNSVIRAAMAHSANASAKSALTSSTICNESNTPGGDCGFRAETE